jgi:putative hemolysin
MFDYTQNATHAIDSGAVLERQLPAFSRYPKILRQLAKAALRWLINENRINDFLSTKSHLRNFDFIDAVFDHLNIDCRVRHDEIHNIPCRGRVLIVANHPLGGLDGLALLRLVGGIRRDVRIVANELLLNIEPLRGVFLPVDAFGNGTGRTDLVRIMAALDNEEAVIIFPAGAVSRAGTRGIRDRSWLPGFLRIAEKTGSPILPIHVRARNSPLFYLSARFSAVLSMLMLPREMTGFKGKIHLTIGQPVDARNLAKTPMRRSEKAQLVKRHLRRISRGKSPILTTRKSIIHPLDRQAIRTELRQAEKLGVTADDKHILLVEVHDGSAVMDEIGRLREMTFRAVGEGTGQHKDIDRFDRHYRHLVLWDEAALEIAGAYRLGEIWRWHDRSAASLYTHDLFEFSDGMQAIFPNGLELGRSFVQPQYWGRRSLDYLWQGIGAYLAKHPDVRYLFGPVSLSSSLPKTARDMIVHFYGTHFVDHGGLVRARLPHVIDPKTRDSLLDAMPGVDFEADYVCLRDRLAHMGMKVPTLYKQYADVCEAGGVRFCAFNIDPAFNHCTDGFVLVDIDFLKAKKRTRYLCQNTAG